MYLEIEERETVKGNTYIINTDFITVFTENKMIRTFDNTVIKLTDKSYEKLMRTLNPTMLDLVEKSVPYGHVLIVFTDEKESKLIKLDDVERVKFSSYSDHVTVELKTGEKVLVWPYYNGDALTEIYSQLDSEK